MSLDVTTLALAKSYTNQHGGSGGSDPIVENAKQTGGFGYTEQGDQTVITWDGDTDGRVVKGGRFCKVSELTPTINEVIGGVIITKTSDGIFPAEITADSITAVSEHLYIVQGYGNSMVVVALEDSEVEGITFEPGLYYSKSGSGVESKYIKSFTYGTPDTVHKIDEKYLPVIPAVTNTATVGQTIKVSAVDENGKPTKWEAVDMPSGGGSVPKPLTYDYMPEGYPKKDGWSIVWDGNTEGKVAAVGAQLYKISDMMPTYDDLWSAALTPIGLPGDPAAVSDLGMTEDKVSGNITEFVIGRNLVHLYVISENNASFEGITFPTKGTYISFDAEHFKLGVGSGVITPMSTDFMPKNFNVVFRAETGNVPTSCNVAYDELRDWVERGVPVFSAFIYTGGSQYVIHNITIISLLTDALGFGYYDRSGNIKAFKYKSDGTIATQSN